MSTEIKCDFCGNTTEQGYATCYGTVRSIRIICPECEQRINEQRIKKGLSMTVRECDETERERKNYKTK